MVWIGIRKNCRNKRSLIDTMEIEISSGQQAAAQIPEASKRNEIRDASTDVSHFRRVKLEPHLKGPMERADAKSWDFGMILMEHAKNFYNNRNKSTYKPRIMSQAS